MNNVIEVSEEEAVENLQFLINLVDRGTSVKIIRSGGRRIMMVPLPSVQDEIAPNEIDSLPVDTSFVNPTATQNYVAESLSEMSREFNN